MQTSPSIAAISAALAKAQKVIKPAVFDRTNPHFKNKYATLPSIMDAIRAPLADNGIAIFQGAEADGAQVKVTTRLAHSSGEWVESTLTMTAQQNTPQGVMAALTYCRRGSLSLVCVVSDDDDDGEQASKPTGKPATVTPITKGTQVQEAKRSVAERQRDFSSELTAMGYEPDGIRLVVKSTLGRTDHISEADMDRLEGALVIIRAENNEQKREAEDIPF